MLETTQIEQGESEEADIDLSVIDLGPKYRAAGDGGISSGCSCKQNILEDSEDLDDLAS